MRTVKNTDTGESKNFLTDEAFLEYARDVYKKNEDGQPYPSEIHWLPENIQQATEYIEEYCSDLELIEDEDQEDGSYPSCDNCGKERTEKDMEEVNGQMLCEQCVSDIKEERELIKKTFTKEEPAMNEDQFKERVIKYLKEAYYLELNDTNLGEPGVIQQAIKAGQTPEERVDEYAEKYDLEKFD